MGYLLSLFRLGKQHTTHKLSTKADMLAYVVNVICLMIKLFNLFDSILNKIVNLHIHNYTNLVNI